MTKVLIIEDDPIIANIYRSRLDKEGFQVEIAPDGQAGFYRIHETRPDAILLDLMLPKMDGIQILKKIRAQKQFQQVPVMVFTNAYLPNMVQEAKLAGATQVFNKAALTPKQVVDSFNQALFPDAVLGAEPPSPPTVPPPPAEPAEPPPPAAGAYPRPASPMPPTGAPPERPFASAFPDPGQPAAPAPGASSAPPRPSRGGIPFPQMQSAPPPRPTSPPEGGLGPTALAGPSLRREPAPLPPSPPARPASPAAEDTEGRTPAAPILDSSNDAEFQAELLRSFLDSMPERLAALRKYLHEFLRAGADPARMAQLLELYRKVHALSGNAAIVGLQNVAQMCAALEALLKELNEKPKNVTPSTTRTLAHGVDFLGLLFEKGLGPNLFDSPPINILVVDDEIISRRAVIYALEKARLKSEAIEDPVVALRLLGEKSYDLVILDVDMPGMNGFELCTKLRALPLNQSTPVVFVTGMTDFESRTRSSLSGGNDLIAKPFLFIELTVKALTFVLRRRLTQLRSATPG